MKKSLFFSAAAALSLLSACSEIGPVMDFSVPADSDTTYVVSPVPVAQSKRVLVEEYTGVRCRSCPAGTADLKSYAESHDNSIVIVGLHGGPLAKPIEEPGYESKYDFRSDKVLALMSNYFAEIPAQPAIAIDRVKLENAYFTTSRTKWPGYMDKRVALSAPVNIEVKSIYKEEERRAVITVRVIYTAEVTRDQALTVWILEDDIRDSQDNQGVYESDYQHNHVLRDALTPVSGSSFLNGLTKEPGRVHEQTFVYTIADPAWKAGNCKIVAFVNDPDDKEVIQVAEAALIP